MKCGEGMCKPVWMDMQTYIFFPGLMMKDDRHYVPFSASFDSVTSEKDQPLFKRDKSQGIFKMLAIQTQ